MADKNKRDAAGGEDTEPHVLEEPGTRPETAEEGPAEPADWEIEEEPENPWMRGLWMLVLAILFGVGEFVLAVAAVFQFLWLVFTREKNQNIAAFGTELADWLARVARFQTGSTDKKPFPFSRWGSEE